jgi:hypothetical protein
MMRYTYDQVHTLLNLTFAPQQLPTYEFYFV